MLDFTHTGQHYPEAKSAELRTQDFDEIYAQFAAQEAAKQASRCSQCGVPFCQIHCPLQNNIPDWLKLAAEGRLEEAYALSSATNNFPEICGRICPQDKLCEGNCVIEKDFGSVTIGAIERYITEKAFENGWVKPAAATQETGFRIAIIGAGPSGFYAAEHILKDGDLHAQVDLFDRLPTPFGLVRGGVAPDHPKIKSVIRVYEKTAARDGFRFFGNVKIGHDLEVEDLERHYHAIVFTVGCETDRQLGGAGVMDSGRVAQGDSGSKMCEHVVVAGHRAQFRAEFGNGIGELLAGEVLLFDVEQILGRAIDERYGAVGVEADHARSDA